MNNVILTGRLTNDPEERYLPSGMAVANFCVAVSKRKKNGEEKTAFINCAAFDRMGENICQYFKKGSKILVQGEIDQNNWTDKQGNKRKDLKILVNQFEFLDPKKPSTETKGNYKMAKEGAYQPQGFNQLEELQEFDDECPF